MDSDHLQGRRVVITGGASGIGRVTAEAFVQAGCRVVLIDRDELALRQAVEALGPTTVGIAADVSDPASIHDAFSGVDRALGGVDVLIANAGISVRRRFLEISSEEWRRVMATNLDGVFFCAREAGSRMMEGHGGVLLLMGSTNGLVGYPYYASYNASKAGVIELARSLSIELAPKVRVNAICPGYVMTPMQEREYTPAMLDKVNGTIPLRRHARPEEIAHLFLFLASDRARYIHGQALVIDGGELAGGLASAGVTGDEST
ncbi:SDR family NAD(P)-dependent oxidoreductase [Stigmatella sp. ncwal1]|uniref:SDR family NAD(P)-dependent oxidoreductase n=1 Tax=Stigmatella ashevillensis TaxID=2995309 RepID=A0ABT5D3U7_9BACT|nr:SDR family oxidoreductase [Stigmatella ashevillena]MDC0708341.1 SDR family NAD(P)-dependent oxidoreductase [Stigmatella ashevillena]